MAYKLNNVSKFLEANYPDISVFDNKDFENNNPKITKFTANELKQGYKKIFLDDGDQTHAEPIILLNKKDENGRYIAVTFANTLAGEDKTLEDDKKIENNRLTTKNNDDLGKNFQLIRNVLTHLPYDQGCAEYAITLLDKFDGKVLLKTKNGIIKSTDIDKVTDLDQFITERQLQLRRGSSLLKQFKIDPEKFQTKDSQNNKMSLSDYYQKYAIEVEDEKGDKKTLNSAFDVLRVAMRPYYSHNANIPSVDDFKLGKSNKRPNSAVITKKALENSIVSQEIGVTNIERIMAKITPIAETHNSIIEAIKFDTGKLKGFENTEPKSRLTDTLSKNEGNVKLPTINNRSSVNAKLYSPPKTKASTQLPKIHSTTQTKTLTKNEGNALKLPTINNNRSPVNAKTFDFKNLPNNPTSRAR